METKDFLQKIRPQWSGCFTYSKEEDTPAANFKGHVAKKISQQRKIELENIQTTITNESLKKYIGQTLEVILEEFIPGFAIGRAWFQAPEVDGAVVISLDDIELQDDAYSPIEKKHTVGDRILVKIIACNGCDLEAVSLQ